MSARQPLDWRDPVVSQRQAMRDLDACIWAPRAFINLRSFGWAIVVLMIFASLMGMLVVGS
jgi:hypothetical protein